MDSPRREQTEFTRIVFSSSKIYVLLYFLTLLLVASWAVVAVSLTVVVAAVAVFGSIAADFVVVAVDTG